MSTPESDEHRHFIQARIDADLAAGKHGGRVHLRFPPEPNGYLHIGHAKAICINFGLAEEYASGLCNLRFDDTNPTKEETEYVDGICEDIRWLGFDWGDRLYYASGYFERLYELAEELIQKGLAYVDETPLEELREMRGDGTRAGRASSFREESVEVNLDKFRRMRAGEFDEGACVLRAKIDLAAANMQLRDPVMYRVLKAEHHRTGDAWCIYPTYDWAHGQSDALEGITHSLCSLEFVNHRPLYDWFLDHLDLEHRPEQIEFARLRLAYTVTSKRKLAELVEMQHVSGWDDPRMPTLRGLRRRGYTPEAIRAFIERIGVAKFNSLVDMVVLEAALREDLNRRAERRMAVLDPIRVSITNWPAGKVVELDAVNNPEDDSAGTRKLTLSGEVFIERDDFRMEAPRKFHRLKPGSEVRLRYGCVIRCDEVIADGDGNVTELRCTYDPESFGGKTSDGRKVKGIVHWVAVDTAIDAEVRLYDHLFRVPEPDRVEDGESWLANLNPDSLRVVANAKLEPSLGQARPGERFQFERVGYFVADADDHSAEQPTFNRSVALRDSWGKIEAKTKG